MSNSEKPLNLSYWEYTKEEQMMLPFPEHHGDHEHGATLATVNSNKWQELWKIERRLADEARADVSRLTNTVRISLLDDLRALVEASHFKHQQPRHQDGCCICAKLVEIRECPTY